MEFSIYEGNMNVEELLDWIKIVEKCFDYEDVEEDQKVKFTMTRLRGHVTLWWDVL